MKKLHLLLLTSVLFLNSCGTVLKVTERKENGLFEVEKDATTLVSQTYDLDQNKSILVVPDAKFTKGMAEKVNYFEKVITLDELEKEIIKEGKQDEIGQVSGKIGLNNVYRKYKKFLYLSFDDNPDKRNRIQLKLTNPENFDDLFVADTAYDLMWAGVRDQNTFYPLFNELIKYIRKNSKTYK